MKNLWIRVAVAAMIVTLGTMGAFAQLNSSAQQITLTATVNESLTVQPSVVSYNFGAVKPGDQFSPAGPSIAITTDYRLNNARTKVSLCAYFASAASAMTGPANNIPSSAIEVRGGAVPGPAFTPINATCAAGLGVPGASLTLANYNVTPATRKNTQVDNFELNLNLTTLSTLNADTYTGTLNVQAQATP